MNLETVAILNNETRLWDFYCFPINVPTQGIFGIDASTSGNLRVHSHLTTIIYMFIYGFVLF